MTPQTLPSRAPSQDDAYTDLVRRIEENLGRSPHATVPSTHAPRRDAYIDLVHRIEQNLDRSARRHAAPGRALAGRHATRSGGEAR